MRRLRALAGALLLSGAWWPAANAATEYELKAAVMYRMLHFIEWPGPADAVLRLCVYGAQPYEDALKAIAQQKVGAHALILALDPPRETLGECQVVFLARSMEGELEALAPELNSPQPRLTVSDIEDFGCHGGMVTLRLEQGRIRFSVNREAAASRGLNISAKLLELGAPLACEAAS
jgi:hypothetical protein